MRQMSQCAIMALMALPLLFTGACSERPHSSAPPRLVGAEPISATSVTGYRDVLSAWMTEGYRNRTVIHIGPKDGLAFVPDKKLSAIKSFLTDGSSGADTGGRITGDNYLFVASRLGLVNRIFWITPYNHFSYINAEERVLSFVRNQASIFRQQDIDSLRFRNGCVSGNLAGVETSLCSPSTIPQLAEPALVLLDTGFFPVYAAERGISTLHAMKELFDLMALQKIRTPAFFVVSSPEAAVMHGYLSGEALAILKEPSTTKQESPPPLWTARDQADNMLSGGGIREAAQYLQENIGAHADDPYLILMQATARAMLGKREPALQAMAVLCAEKPSFCSGIADAGVLLRERGDLAGAEAFFLKALSLRPDLDSARLEYALTLYASRRYAEAKSEASALSQKSSFAVAGGFLLGDCALAEGRETEAIDWYEKALASYGNAGGYRLSRREQESLARLKSLYTKRNHQEGLKSLKKTPLGN